MKRDRRALLQETGVLIPPARVPVEHLVDHTMTPAGCTLHLGDGHLLLVQIPDGINQLGLFPGQFRHLTAPLPVQGSKKPGCDREFLLGSDDTTHPVYLINLPLLLHKDCIRLDQVEEHVRVSPVL